VGGISSDIIMPNATLNITQAAIDECAARMSVVGLGELGLFILTAILFFYALPIFTALGALFLATWRWLWGSLVSGQPPPLETVEDARPLEPYLLANVERHESRLDRLERRLNQTAGADDLAAGVMGDVPGDS
jgi:hypothetical protein